MSALDEDGDSVMQSSLAMQESTASFTPVTPDTRSNALTSELSPPSSQGVPIASPLHGANANGKRPLSTLDVNGDAPPPLRSAQAAASGPAEVQTHQPSGYTWTKQEDEPGWSWKSKRALDEANRAQDSLVMKDLRVGDRYGDPFAMADQEQAMMKSQGQQ
ncbi:hypothetical protein MBLNU457_5645t1 [Dothideomycetes sp. NU457]